MAILPDNWATVFNGFLNSSVGYIFWSTVALLILGGIAWYIYHTNQMKNIFIYPVTIRKMRENGTIQEFPNYRGGAKKGKNGILDFRILMGKFYQINKNRWLGYVPDPRLIGIDNRVHLLQIGDGTLMQQCEVKLVASKEGSILDVERINKEQEKLMTELQAQIESKAITVEDAQRLWNQKTEEFKNTFVKIVKFNLLVEPVPTDVKTKTLNDIQSARHVLSKEKITVYAIGIFAFVLMAITHVAFIYFNRK